LDSLENHFIELINKRIGTWWKEASQLNIDNKPYPQNNVIVWCYKEIIKLNENIHEMGGVIDNYKKEIKNLTQQVKINTSQCQSYTSDIKKLKEEIDQMRKGKHEGKSHSENKNNSVSVSDEDVVEIFNEWARDPKIALPSLFKYADGKLDLREKQAIDNGNFNSLWIVNKTGQKKYVFPNPKIIEQIAGDIDAIYTVNGTRKAKGQNKIIILDACELRDDGWIEYKGKLDLI